MKRFIRYLYEYEDKKRIRNVGFIKIESGCEETIVHMQAKGFHDGRERKLVLYLFFEEKDRIVGIPLGEVCLTSPVLSWNFMFSANDVGGEENYCRICGVLIETESGRRMAATWDDSLVDVSRMYLYESGGEAEAEQVTQAELDVRPAEEISVQGVESAGLTDQTEENICPAEKVPQIKERVQQIKRTLTKISIQELSRLPRCEWKLANNRFLIHGYNNFHHLLLIEEGNYLKLGVPGIYHIQEAKCAREFGFEEFISYEELQDSFEIQEINWDNQDDSELWGYWCRPVRKRLTK